MGHAGNMQHAKIASTTPVSIMFLGRIIIYVGTFLWGLFCGDFFVGTFLQESFWVEVNIRDLFLEVKY
jgi:hypothetical protein